LDSNEGKILKVPYKVPYNPHSGKIFHESLF